VKINTQNLIESDVENEVSDFNKSIEISIRELEKILGFSLEIVGEENSKIFEAQIQILKDNIFIDSVTNRIKSEKMSAGYIFNDELTKLSNILLASKGEYMKERLVDINDVKNRVIRNMKREKLVSKVLENSIIIAHEITPADTILFNRRNVKGYATDVGGVTSHAAILSRALRVPAIVGMISVSKHIVTGDSIIIDGLEGQIIVNPTEETRDIYGKKIEEFKKHEEKLLGIISLPCETLDGKAIELTTNIEFDEEVDFIANYANCGIGLYRTEHLYIEKGGFPSEAEQIEEYSHISSIIYPNKVTIRTFDIGGDKLLSSSQKESNPNIGWRGIRISLDWQVSFKEQLRALLISSTRKNIRIMFPMISSIEEVRAVKQVLNEVKEKLDGEGKKYDANIPVGIMVEVPSAAMLADDLAKEVDFFSIGTNDLTQFILAVDRGNVLISNMFQPLHPAVIRTLKKVIEDGHRNNISVSVCGEMASDPIAALVLIGFGIDELSVTPSMVPEIKQLIRSVNYSEITLFAEKLLSLSTEKEIKTALTSFYKEKVESKINQ
jgi:phosphoenolpyruvate-protein phosphotransferase